MLDSDVNRRSEIVDVCTIATFFFLFFFFVILFFFLFIFFFFLMIRRPPRSTLDRSSAASDVYKRQNIYDPKNMNNPLAVVPAGQEKRFDLTDQTEVIIKFGSQEERIKVLPNKAPEVKIERVTTLSLIHISEPTRPY